LLVVSAAAANAPARTLKHASRPIAVVAMDGSRVAYVTDDDAVRVWNVQTGASTQLRRGSGHYVNLPLIPEVAIAGTRVAWITLSVSGNSEETFANLYESSSSARCAKKIAHAYRVHEFGGDNIQRWRGDWIGGLVGSGTLLAVSWTTTPSDGGPSLEAVSNGRLSLIMPTGALHRIASGDKAIIAASGDKGRIAVLRPDGSVGVYSATGTLLRQITPSSAQELAYGGGRLVVLTKTKTLEVYDARSGARLHAWPVQTKAAYLQAWNLRAYGRIGVYFVDTRSLDQRMHLVNLATGEELVLSPTQHPWGAAGAAVGPLGLVHSVNTYKFGAHPAHIGTLVFLSAAKVLSMIKKGS
jgi:hypothetical protein